MCLKLFSLFLLRWDSTKMSDGDYDEFGNYIGDQAGDTYGFDVDMGVEIDQEADGEEAMDSLCVSVAAAAYLSRIGAGIFSAPERLKSTSISRNKSSRRIGSSMNAMWFSATAPSEKPRSNPL